MSKRVSFLHIFQAIYTVNNMMIPDITFAIDLFNLYNIDFE